MSPMLASVVLAAAEETHPLVAPAVIFPLIAIGIFMLLGAVTWSYRDVAHRHIDKGVGQDPSHGSGH